jgi:hypothetical protein
MSDITNQWVKMNPFEAAARLNELERENSMLRADLLIEEERSIYWRDNEAKAMAENAELRAALERLRDCDWVITPQDRMDAVREIARKALEGKGTQA